MREHLIYKYEKQGNHKKKWLNCDLIDF